MKKKDLLKKLQYQIDLSYQKRAIVNLTNHIGAGEYRYWTGYINGLEFCKEILLDG